MKEMIILLDDSFDPKDGDFVIGVEKGALHLAKLFHYNFIACGDFDSVDIEEFRLIERQAKKVVVLSKEKDTTDFGFALKLIPSHVQHIKVYGALGGRRDHEYLNVMYLYDDPRLVYYNVNNKISLMERGEHVVKKEYKYTSFLTFGESRITLKGFKYPLVQESINYKSRHTTSNEILGIEAFVLIEGDPVLCIQSDDA